MLGPIVLALVVFVALYMLSIYNRLVRLRNNYKNAYAQIDVQLKRRYDLIPNLVETAKGYMKHESQTLEAVIKARNQAYNVMQSLQQKPGDAELMTQLGQVESALTQSMSRFMAVSESYPDLKANTTMNQLMEELSSTENKISFSRQAYNDAAMIYNNEREVFPNSLVAGSFTAATLLEVTNAVEREAVKVSF